LDELTLTSEKHTFFIHETESLVVNIEYKSLKLHMNDYHNTYAI